MAHVWRDGARGNFVADMRDILGKVGGLKRFEKRKDAVAYINEVKAAQKHHGAYIDPSMTPVLLEWGDRAKQKYAREASGAIAKWAEGQHAAAHVGDQKHQHARHKEQTLEQVSELTWGLKPLREYRVGEIRAPMMQDVAKTFAKQLGAQKTLERKWGFVVQFFDYCVAVGWCQQNPAKLPRGVGLGLPTVSGKPRKRHANFESGGDDEAPTYRISRETVAAIIEAADEKYQLAIKVAAGTGIRQGEQRGLKWGASGLDTTAGMLHVTKAIDSDSKLTKPKNSNAVRSIPLAPALLSELREWRIAQPPEQRKNNLVFPSPTGSVIDDRALRERGLYRACERAGVDLIRWHDLRHYFASALLFDPSFTDATVTQLLGHHSISFTLSVYGHWMADKKRDAGIAEALGRAL